MEHPVEDRNFLNLFRMYPKDLARISRIQALHFFSRHEQNGYLNNLLNTIAEEKLKKSSCKLLKGQLL